MHIDLLGNTYDPQQTCMPHCTCVPLQCYCSLHIDHITTHINKTKQQFATLHYHAIATYVPSTNIPSNTTYAKNIHV